MGKKKKKEMLLNEMNIFMRIPEDADFNEHVTFGDDYDARFVLTEKGRELAEAMKKEKLT